MLKERLSPKGTFVFTDVVCESKKVLGYLNFLLTEVGEPTSDPVYLTRRKGVGWWFCVEPRVVGGCPSAVGGGLMPSCPGHVSTTLSMIRLATTPSGQSPRPRS